MGGLLGDAWTVLSKELQELLFVRSREPMRMAINLLVLLLLGVALPLVAGPYALDQTWLLTLWAWAPVFLVASIVADSIAGERENHTFETLLASRLPDRAILLGKVGAAVCYGWGLMLVTVVLSLITINVAYAGSSLLLYRPLMAIGGGLLSLLASTLAASVGVLISLRADSLRQARRWTLASLIALLIASLLALPLMVELLPPSWNVSASALLRAFDSVQVLATLTLLLAVVNVIMLVIAAGSFQRHRLNLN
ncbi:MAG: ABC transporter permease [Caldilineaceae bacterium]